MDPNSTPQQTPPVAENSPVSPTTPAAPDRSALQNLYPTPTANVPSAAATTVSTGYTPPPTDLSKYDDANSSLYELVTLILGGVSASAYILIIYWTKSIWGTVAVSAILAVAALYFAFKSYRINNKMSPLLVIGISAATIALAQVANLLVEEALLHSLYSSF